MVLKETLEHKEQKVKLVPKDQRVKLEQTEQTVHKELRVLQDLE
jgi:hypothetical protein